MMITVKKAESLILKEARSFGVEKVDLQLSLNRVLAESIAADRDYPPFNRATMDGIAISFDGFKKGTRSFKVIAVIAAGQKPVGIKDFSECVKIMTGAAVPDSCDTVIPVEDLKISNGEFLLRTELVKKGQFIHPKGIDKKGGEVVLRKGTFITPEVISVLSSVGVKDVMVIKLPKIFIVTTGDELVDIDKKPNPYQIRRSNDYVIEAGLSPFGVKVERCHIKDDKDEMKKVLQKNLSKYDAIIFSGGVSKGEFDYVYKVLEQLKVKKIFHGIAQKPGKPMWFGKYKKTVVFALPGNPVSSFLCLNRYIIPWLRGVMEVKTLPVITRAVLKNDSPSNPDLTLFSQASLTIDDNGKLLALSLLHHGSGDFISVVGADCFIELPPKKGMHKKGGIYKIWPIKPLQ